MAAELSFAGIHTSRASKQWGKANLSGARDSELPAVRVALVNGASHGPTVWILAGIHGDELEAMVATQRIVRDLDPAKLSGAVIAMPIVNVTAFAAWERESPVDGKDLNRVFPGDEAGTFTERLAHGIFAAMLPIISPDDCILNLHGGGRTVLSANLIELRGTGDAVEQRSTSLAVAACNPNLRIIARIDERTGEWATLYKGTLLREIFNKVPAARLTIEAGGMGRLDQGDILAHYDAILNTMKTMEMYPGELKQLREKLIRTPQNVRVMPTKRGFWQRHVEAGAHVAEGQPVASVLDEIGEEIEILRSPFSGIILYIRGFGLVDPLSSKLGYRYGANIGRYS